MVVIDSGCNKMFLTELTGKGFILSVAVAVVINCFADFIFLYMEFEDQFLLLIGIINHHHHNLISISEC